MVRGTLPAWWYWCLHPSGEPLMTHTSTGIPPTSASRFGSVSFGGHCSFPLDLGAHKILFMSSKTGISVSPSPVEVLKSNPAGLQGPVPWGSLFAGSPGWETWHGVQNLHNSERTSMILLFPSLWVTHPADMGIWFYLDCVPPTVSLGLLLCLWI